MFVLPHWGQEHSYYPPKYCKECGKQMIDAGADAVIGSHPHVINPYMSYKGKTIYFSLGNFMFPDKCMQVPRPMYYPSTQEELRSLRRVWTYPNRLRENVVAVWHGKNRIGLTAEIRIKNGHDISFHQRLIILSSDNILQLHCKSIYLLRFRFLSLLMRLPLYGVIRRCLQSRYNFVGRRLNKLPLFNVPVMAEKY